MKITLSRSQWEGIGKKAGWMKKAMGAPEPTLRNKTLMLKSNIDQLIRELKTDLEDTGSAGLFIHKYPEYAKILGWNL